MQKISVSQLEGYTADRKAKRDFLRKSFRFGGFGAILFLTAIVLVVFKGMELGTEISVVLFVLAFAGLGFECILHFKARRKKPLCRSCGSVYMIYKNIDRPNDTEYLYVCNECCSYFSILHSEEAKDIT